MQVARRHLLPLATTGAMAAIIAICSVCSAAQLELRFLDVGQGDAILLREDEHVALIDTGPSDKIVKKLRRLGVSALDLLVVSHNHDDHIGGADAVLSKVRVGTYLDNAYPAATLIQDRVLSFVRERRIAYGTPTAKKFRLGQTELTFLLPMKFAGGDAQNNRSVVVLVEHGKFKALLAGDAEVEELNALLALNAVPDVDVLKASHHGSRNGVTPLWLFTTKPKVVVISVGAGNDYGHPHESAMRYYRSAERRVFQTSLDGDVSVQVDDDGRYTVTTTREKDRALPKTTGDKRESSDEVNNVMIRDEVAQ